jgi:Holliday junction DNA helicase RuvA
MISRITGTLVARGIDRIEVMTAGGIGYTVQIPLGVLEGLPRPNERVDLFTALVVKEDGWQLFGFATESDRALFHTLLGVGPALALGLLSALGAGRVVRAIRERDLPTLQSAPRVGKKIAERLCVELGDKMKEFAGDMGGPAAGPSLDGGAADAVRALVQLGYTQPEAEKAVRKAVEKAKLVCRDDVPRRDHHPGSPHRGVGRRAQAPAAAARRVHRPVEGQGRARHRHPGRARPPRAARPCALPRPAGPRQDHAR